MKKKLLSTVTAIVCLVVCVLWFSACSDSKTDGTDNEEAEFVAIESITLDKNKLILEVGGEETLIVTVLPDNATNKTVTWSSDNTAVATVSNGVVKAITQGTAIITAKSGEKTATCAVTVTTQVSSDEISDEQWVQAFENINNFIERNASSTTKVDGDKIEIVSTTNNMELTMIYVKDGENYYVYTKYGDSWRRKTSSNSSYSSMAETVFLSATFSKDKKAEFTYDKTNEEYVAESITYDVSVNAGSQTTTRTVKNVKIKFEDGKIVSIKYNDIVIDSFGTTIIELPTDFTAN